MPDQGTVYIFNMCNQSTRVTLNKADDPKGAIDPIAKTSPYTPSFHPAPRTENPAPFQLWALGSGNSDSKNELQWYLGTDRSHTRHVTLSLTQLQSHLEEDCQIYLFYDAAVLRWAGHSETVQAQIAPSV